MASIQVKATEKSEMSKVLSLLKQLQIDMSQLQTSISRIAQQVIDMDSIKPKIVEAFDVDFIKQVRYENNTYEDGVKLVVIYKHDDFNFAMDVIFDRFGKLQKQFPDVYIEMMFYSTTEIESSDLEDTTIIFKREE